MFLSSSHLHLYDRWNLAAKEPFLKVGVYSEFNEFIMGNKKIFVFWFIQQYLLDTILF